MQHIFWLLPGAVAGRAGPNLHPWDARELRAGGIGAVLSVNDGAACHPEDFSALGMSYRCIPLSDNAPPRDGDLAHCLDALPQAYDYVRGELQRRRAVLVHCRSGKDRTGLFMCYFLMRESGISVDGAIKAVRRVRPIALSAEGWEGLAVAVLEAGSSRAVAES
jgi:protein-tyrosine phosphatase